ncbi:MAG TPA: hypothetical protein VKE74_21680 [Gemmataceae bacterium]|nr:hypothetical protein [Gemmataceae bacterium]
MRRVGCWLGLLALAAAGCSSRPFAHDPLLHHSRGVWGDRERARLPTPPPPPEPTGPEAPPGGIGQRPEID